MSNISVDSLEDNYSIGTKKPSISEIQTPKMLSGVQSPKMRSGVQTPKMLSGYATPKNFELKPVT